MNWCVHICAALVWEKSLLIPKTPKLHCKACVRIKSSFCCKSLLMVWTSLILLACKIICALLIGFSLWLQGQEQWVLSFDCSTSVFLAQNNGFCSCSVLAGVTWPCRRQITIQVQSSHPPIFLAPTCSFSCLLIFSQLSFVKWLTVSHVSFLHLLCLYISFFLSSPCCSFALCFSLTHLAQYLDQWLPTAWLNKQGRIFPSVFSVSVD